MKRTLWLVSVALVVGLGAAFWRALTPKIGHATRAAIVAQLPSSLRNEERPDPAGVARYGRLVGLSRVKPAFSVDALESLLAEGPLAVPADGGDRFPDSARFKAMAKGLRTQSDAAARRKDPKACARLVRLNLRLADALTSAGGTFVDHLVAVGIEAIANRAAYEAEMRGGLDAAGRMAVLESLPTLDPAKDLARALRREFYGYPMAVLLNPEHGGNKYYGLKSDPERDGVVVGTFDPLATAREEGRLYDAAIQNLSRPLDAQSDLPDRIAAAANAGLPDAEAPGRASEGLPRSFAKLVYRIRMNNGANTIGRTMISGGLFDSAPRVGARRAADRNLVRAVFLIRTGRPASLSDPLSKGPIRLDAKRRLLWSVGENGRDDGGRFTKMGSLRDPDFGYRY